MRAAAETGPDSRDISSYVRSSGARLDDSSMFSTRSEVIRPRSLPTGQALAALQK